MKCFYHNDADGKCSAFWVKYYLGKILKIDFIEMDYTKEFPINSIEKDEEIWIVDYSIDPYFMDLMMLLKTNRITWIDHHKTAIEKYEILPYAKDIRGIRKVGIAACMLTYCYLSQMTLSGVGPIKDFHESMMDQAPWFTKYIADWDVMTLKYGDKTKQFVTAFSAGDFGPNGTDWSQTGSCSLPTEKMVNEGKLMLKFRDQWAKNYLSLGFETLFAGHSCFTLNLGHCNSEYFNSLPLGKYDIYIAFAFNGSVYTVSLYSKTVDVSEIAKTYGGGGHTGAAGFVCKKLPFSMTDSIIDKINRQNSEDCLN